MKNPLSGYLLIRLIRFLKIKKTDEKILITGATNIIQQPEFDDPEKFQSVIELIEDKDIIIHIMDKKKFDNSIVMF
jgi:transcriptional regulator of heat shock response